METSARNGIRCPVSGGTALATGETHADGAITYSLYECADCQLQFWQPMKNPGAEWYRHDDRYASRNFDPPKTPANNHRAFLKSAPLRGGRLLDVGCGTGNFLTAAKAAGYKVRGIDFDADAVTVAQERFGLKEVTLESLGNLRAKGERYDILTFFEVLEHMDNPTGFIKEVKDMLNPEGYIGLSVPYRRSWDVFKNGDKPPRHLTRWDEHSMSNFLERHGFHVIEIRPLLVEFDFLVTKFHFWFGGILSFGLVNKFRALKTRRNTVQADDRTDDAIISSVKTLAKAKDYILFSIPAVFLLLYLVLIGRQYVGMYTLARLK